MVRYGGFDHSLSFVMLVGDRAHFLTDTLHQTRGQGLTRVGVYQLVLDGGRTGVDHQNGVQCHKNPLRYLRLLVLAFSPVPVRQ